MVFVVLDSVVGSEERDLRKGTGIAKADYSLGL